MKLLETRVYRGPSSYGYRPVIRCTIDLEELEDQLAELPASYVRIKGIARTSTSWVAFHRVGLRVSSEPLERQPSGFGDNHGRIVALGRDLRQDQLAACVRAAIAAYSP